jgi:DNA-binding beta-propeller fold protein YncE
MNLRCNIWWGLCCLLFGAHVAASAQNGEAHLITGSVIDVDLAGNLFVLDGPNATITMYDRNLQRGVMAGGPGWESGRFDQPAGIWARNGLDVLVADYGNHRIQRFDRTLSFISSFSTRESENPDERFGFPTDVALSRLGELFLCDSENNRIVKVNSSNRVETTFGGFGGGEGKLQHPLQIEVGANDWVYVLDPPRVLVYDGFGNYLSRLPEGVLVHPSVIFADAKGCLVADGDSVFCFDEAHRPVKAWSASALLMTGTSVHIRSLVAAGGKLYCLCVEGLYIMVDPRE